MLNAQFNKKTDFLCCASAVAGAFSTLLARKLALEGLSLEGSMRKLVWILGLVAILPGTAARAQLADPGSVGVAVGHVQFAVQDMCAAKKFGIAVGGKPASKLGANEVVKFPGVLILIRKAMDPTAGTVGSTVNHIGFLVPNVAEARAKWMAAGVIMEPPNPANANKMFLQTPYDVVRVELRED